MVDVPSATAEKKERRKKKKEEGRRKKKEERTRMWANAQREWPPCRI